MLSETNLTSTKQSSAQLPLFGYSSNCEADLHSYYNSKEYNADGQPICKYCGANINDWKRIYRLDIQDIAFTSSQLKTKKFRLEWWSKELDQRAKNHALRKGLINMREAVVNRLSKSISEVYEMPDGTFRPDRDGFQTPYTGNSIYYAQHALACCA